MHNLWGCEWNSGPGKGNICEGVTLGAGDTHVSPFDCDLMVILLSSTNVHTFSISSQIAMIVSR